MNKTKPSGVVKKKSARRTGFMSSLINVPKILNFKNSLGESESGDELESVECDLSGKTYENKCFKKKSTIEGDNPLTYISVEKSIWNEMRLCGGRTNLLGDKNITKDNVKSKCNEASQTEKNIILLWCALHKGWYLFEQLIALGSDPWCLHYFTDEDELVQEVGQQSEWTDVKTKKRKKSEMTPSPLVRKQQENITQNMKKKQEDKPCLPRLRAIKEHLNQMKQNKETTDNPFSKQESNNQLNSDKWYGVVIRGLASTTKHLANVFQPKDIEFRIVINPVYQPDAAGNLIYLMEVATEVDNNLNPKRLLNVNVINKWYSALHCAAIGKKTETAKLLLDNGAKLNSMANGPSYETPLYMAVEADAVDCVQLFVNRGAELHQEGKLSNVSPFFRAAELGHSRCLEVMLKTKKISCSKVRKSDSGNTVLHVAAENGNSDCIETILCEDVNPNLTNNNCQTPLHLAVKTNSSRCVEVLLHKGKADPNLKDSNSKTALHAAVELVSDSRRDILNVLLRYGADVNATDLHGFTPLHTAALNELTQSVLILISHGADMSIKSKLGITAFGLVARKTPAALSVIKDKLSEFITLVHEPESLNDIEIQFNFKLGLHHPKEYCLLNTFIEEGQQDILLHPFCMAFLYVTWCRIRRCYYGMIFVTFMFSLSFLFYLLTALAQDCARRAVDAHLKNQTAPCYEDSFLNNILSNSPLALETQWYILLYFAVCLLYRKIYGLRGYLSFKEYFANIGNIFEWISIASVFLISFLYTGKVELWQIHLGAFALMFAWTNMMFLVGQLPMFGPYVEMFHKVLSEFFKLLLVYSSLLVGYTISFCIFFPNTAAFANPIIGFLTVLVMMTGDMNFDILLDHNNEQSSSYLAKPGAQIMYTFFLVFVSIVLMNLLMGIAVHDIQGLQKTADLNRLIRQTKLSSYIELSHYNQNKCIKCPMEMFKFVPKPYIGILKVKPLDPLENKLPKDILQAAYKLVKRRHSPITLSNQMSDAALNWKKLLRRTEYDLKNRNPMNQLFNKLEGYFTQIDSMRVDLKDLKRLIQSNSSGNLTNIF
ncbi:transient receptor potential cation channel subfamily A member 1-like [Rhynchophorus ferrugineus]|uniref:transient receptor potential cation channel subfamily A member 1-like n=1 Tax=Rhynchophorus ferrugineus TaxID=354439 RepID=UPI003FCCFA67